MIFSKKFKPKKQYDLIRLGKDHDGGYLVEKESLLRSQSLIGMGIGYDWSFEEDFHKMRSVPVHAYDPSYKYSFWRTPVRAWISKRKVSIFFLKKKEFKKFFAPHSEKKFFKEKIESKLLRGTSLSKALSKIKLFPVFLKIDIEESEYAILNELVEHASKISGLVIEFHKLDTLLGRVESFIEDFPLELVHIHANNGSVSDDNSTINVIELTFAWSPKIIGETSTIPHPLDQPNCPFLGEGVLEFESS